jgi:hypothetical protein
VWIPDTSWICEDRANTPQESGAFGRAIATTLLAELGWPRSDILDLGGIVAARGTEMYLPLWLVLFQRTGTGHLNIRVVTG